MRGLCAEMGGQRWYEGQAERARVPVGVQGLPGGHREWYRGRESLEALGR
nr:MAG TPA: hypothetical protein [Caudoviricetes sp.]